MTERVLERQARHRLAVLRHVEEISGNVAATCRYYGISRNCYCKWLRRYEAGGLAGLKDRSSAPRYSPRATRGEVAEKIVWLRKHYHFGPEWEDYCNYHRPHGALGGQTPYERLRQKAQDPLS
ncbi:MAG TPA: leucine zipper domain-containing protein [Streptosporangiaceae bacterium]